MPDVTDPVAHSASPEPGWYADPGSPDELRFWDGARWTEERRARQALDEAFGDSPLWRRWWPATLVAVVAIVVVGVAITVAARGGSGTGKRHVSTASLTHAIPAACSYPEPRPSASEVLWWFDVHEKMPSMATPQVRAQLPEGACSAATFSDERVKDAVNLVIAMPSAAEASALSQSLGGSSFADYQYVVELNAREQPFQSAYQSALAAYVQQIQPTVPAGVSVSP